MSKANFEREKYTFWFCDKIQQAEKFDEAADAQDYNLWTNFSLDYFFRDALI